VYIALLAQRLGRYDMCRDQRLKSTTEVKSDPYYNQWEDLDDSPIGWHITEVRSKLGERNKFDRRGRNYPHGGGNSKTRVHGICFSQMRVPPPQNGTNRVGVYTLMWLKQIP